MKNRTVAICAIIVALTLFFITEINSVKATTAFDGLYDITYTSIAWQGFPVGQWDNWTSYTRVGYVSISNGTISIPSSYDWLTPTIRTSYESEDRQGPPYYWITWRGSINEAGNAKWTGGIWEMTGWNFEDYVFTFTGKINPDGTGSGTYTGVLPYVTSYLWEGEKGGTISGTWTLRKQGSEVLPNILGGLGTGPALIVIILIFVLVPAVVVAIIVRQVRKSRKAKKQGFQPPKEVIHGRPQNKTTYEPAPPERETKPMGGESPPFSPQTGTGITFGPRPPEHPKITHVLFDKSGGKVELDWTQPDFDTNGMYGKYHLDGFEIVELRYDGLESPSHRVVDKLPAGATGWVHSYNQTYKFNSSGDIEGYVVNALVSYIDENGNKVILRLASAAFSPVGGAA